MKMQRKILLSVVVSLAISTAGIFFIFHILRDIERESLHSRAYDVIRNKAYALNLLTTGFQNRSDPSRVHQIRDIQRSLEKLLEAMTAFDTREESLIRQVRTNSRELAYSIDKLISDSLEPGGAMEAKRYNLLVSQLWMKTQFISDDIHRLMAISQSRLAVAHHNTDNFSIALVVMLMLTNAAIYFLSGRSIVRIQEGLRHALAKAEEGDQMLSALMDYLPEGITITDEALNLTRVSRYGQNLLGGPHEGMSATDIAAQWKVYWADGKTPMADEDLPLVRAVRHGEIVEDMELVQVSAGGKLLPLLCRAGPIHDAHRNIIGGIAAWRDITARKEAEEALRTSEERFRAFMDHSPTIAWIKDEEGRHIYMSKTLEDRFGLRFKDWHGKTDAELWPAEIAAEFRKNDQTVLDSKRPIEVTEATVNQDGSLAYWLTCKFPFYDAAGNRFVAGIGLEITARKQAEEALREKENRLRASLEEKEVLLKEIHHRVKNNMQIISSLVALQADELQDPVICAVLQDVTHRVRSMAMVHEKLYQSADLARVEFDEYARSLLNYLWRSYGSEASGIRLSMDLEPVSLPVDLAVPCGLILNELVTNALKHALGVRPAAEVSVSLRARPQDRVTLCVRDNGVGLPEGLDWTQARTLGLRLVQMLAGQLHANMEVVCSGGTEFTITFNGPKI